MRIRLLNLAALERKRHALAMFTASVCLICFACTQVASQLTNPKRITALTLGETSEGSQVTVTGDSILDDYEAFRRGDRFYVRIPAADFVAAQPRFHGNGFEDVQIQKVGDSVVISFRLHPGANARVIGVANRLNVIFTSHNNFAVSNSGSAIRNRVARNSAGEKSSPLRSFPKAGHDVAGPMPPASVTTHSVLNENSSSRSSQRGTGQTGNIPTKTALPAGTPAPANAATPLATPYPPSSPYSAPYPTYTPAAVQPLAETSNRSFDFAARGRAALLWVRTNKTISAGVGIAVMGLLAVVIFFLTRRRRTRGAAKANATRVQPKYDPEGELEEMLASGQPIETTKVGPGRYVDQVAYENWDGDSFGDLTTNTKAEVTYDEAVAPTPNVMPSEQSWDTLPVPNAAVYKSRVHEEREVFEL
ncbi:MAG TPA: hypothetical protein VJV03_12405 [Pyrinomonadaceae bacterium]|nr:hypothetical protein [Pyrinomonadaceae bacterium]